MSNRKIASLSLLAVIELVVVCAVSCLAAPKNVIMFIGDGMGPEQIKAGGMYAYGSAGTLSFESFPYQGYLTTYSADNAVTDSAAAATALATGFKVNNGVISVALPGSGAELQTLLEYSKALGKSTGLVTTVYVEHATPAAFGAHETSRNNVSQIAGDYLNRSQPNILFGGCYYTSGADGYGYVEVFNRAEMQALNPDVVTKVSGQFATGASYMPYEYDGLGDKPHLSEMTATALDILDNDSDGFFLMVEGGKIDEACHSNDLPRAVREVVEFSNAVQVALNWVIARGETDYLILVAADHETGGLYNLQNKGIGVYPTGNWTTTNHTAANVRVFALGVNADMISGVMNNTDMFAVVTATPNPAVSDPVPANAATQVAVNAQLSWTAGTDAISHNVYFGTMTPPPFIGNQFETTYNPGPLSNGETYYWRIDEVGPAGPTEGSVWSFTTADLPGPASYPNPTDGATDVAITAQLSWTTGSNTSSHDVFFGTSNPPSFVGNQAGTTYNPGTLNYGVTYYWRIDEVGPGGTTTGLVWSFTTDSTMTENANADIPVAGTIGGSYTNTFQSDDVYETITEKLTGGKPSVRYSMLEHKWTFSISSATTVTFYIEAFKTPSGDGDNFVFAYSLDDSTYTDMVTVTSTTDSDTLQSYVLPGGTSGTVYIRVKDTDHTAGNLNIDTISIDRIYILVEAGPPDTAAPVPDPMTWAIVPQATGSTSISMTATIATDPSGVEYFFKCTTVGGHDSGWQDSPVYEDTGLIPETQYTYRVQARDKSMNQNVTTFSGESSAKTLASVLPGQATEPSPPDGGTDNRKTVILSWQAGENTISHNVYLGTNPTLTSADFKGNQTTTTYDPPVLSRNVTYYWRIDEVNESGTTTGTVWSFLAQ